MNDERWEPSDAGLRLNAKRHIWRQNLSREIDEAAELFAVAAQPDQEEPDGRT